MKVFNIILVLSMALTSCMPLSHDVVSDRISKKEGASMNVSSFLNWDGEEDLASSTVDIE